ncbi:MAG: type II secretion system F family protein [Cyanobium sp.]
MTQFTVTYTTRGGRQKVVTLEAASPAEAKRTLRRRGIDSTNLTRKDTTGPAPSTASRAPASQGGWRKFLERPPSIKEKAVFASKLATLVNAGVPILRSIDLIHRQQKSPLFRRALAAMIEEVNQGENLATSMRRWPKVFDKLSIAMVEAGEAGGVLDETLKRLAKLLEENAKLQNQIKGALSYPVSVFAIAILVFLGMTIFVIPTFAGIFKELGADLPVFTQMMVDLSNTLRSSFSIVLIALLLIAAYGLKTFYGTPVGRRRIDRLILQIPLFGDLIQKTATAQFCRTLASLSKAGVPIMMCLEILTETATNTIFADAINNSRVDISEGIPLSTALAMKNVFPELAISMLIVGEETGNMDEMLSKVADFYEDEVTSTAKMLTSLIEPFMIVIVGGIVASILVAMYLPMFSVFEQVR